MTNEVMATVVTNEVMATVVINQRGGGHHGDQVYSWAAGSVTRTARACSPSVMNSIPLSASR